MSNLESDFHLAMRRIYAQARDECDYRATRFIQMVDRKGGLETARQLLQPAPPSDGLMKLWECRRLDISMEALILQPEWKPLFTQKERLEAWKRLKNMKSPCYYYDPGPKPS